MVTWGSGILINLYMRGRMGTQDPRLPILFSTWGGNPSKVVDVHPDDVHQGVGPAKINKQNEECLLFPWPLGVWETGPLFILEPLKTTPRNTAIFLGVGSCGGGVGWGGAMVMLTGLQHFGRVCGAMHRDKATHTHTTINRQSAGIHFFCFCLGDGWSGVGWGTA